jgi:hypothetical protein
MGNGCRQGREKVELISFALPQDVVVISEAPTRRPDC